MLLKDYIQGDKRGEEANRLEREAMNDPFLQGALDGFENVAGDHAKIIERLEKKFTNPPAAFHVNINWLLSLTIAASILLLIVFSTYVILEKDRQRSPVLAEVQSIILPDSSAEESMYSEELKAEAMIIAETSKKTVSASSDLPATSAKPAKSSSAEMTAGPDAYSLSDSSESLATVEISDESTPVEQEKQTKRQVVQAITAGKEAETLSELSALRSKEQMNNDLINTVARSSEKSAFGEKEFLTWCQQKANTNVCAGKVVTMKVSFFIDETGKPSKVEYQKYSCEEAKKEMENLLSSSPVWTNTNRKVTLTIKW